MYSYICENKILVKGLISGFVCFGVSIIDFDYRIDDIFVFLILYSITIDFNI